MEVVEEGTVVGGRYAIGHALGRGAFGAVYAAHDALLDVPLALKMLTRCSPAHVVDLKREFRAASVLNHPNVVALHELGHDEGRWYLTMELLEGSDLGRWVGASTGSSRTATRTAPATRSVTADDEEGAAAAETAEPAAGSRSFEELARAFAQVADALTFVHDAGTLHGDLKPSNVRVTRGDRAVLVDFGLARVLGPASGRAARFRGTPLYAAPEQLAGDADSPAIDLYALGTMLFEAFAGFVPFVGTIESLRIAKRTRRAVSLREATPDVPEEIARLVDALLDPDPAVRPAARRAAAILGADAAGASRRAVFAVRRETGAATLVGRDRETARIADLLGRAGSPFVVVRGPSGVGKTAVAEAAMKKATGSALVLAARCFERERGPFEVLDGLGSSLLEHLDRGALQRDETLDHLLVDVAPLVPSIAARARDLDSAEAPGPPEEREHAVRAFVRLVTHLTTHRRVMLHIDDLQWVDGDGARVLSQLLEGDDAPELAVLATHRPLASGSDRSEPLVRVAGADVVELAPLAEGDAEHLLRSRFAPGAVPTHAIGATLAHARGSPLLLCALGDVLADRGTETVGSLGDVIAARLEGSDVAARTLLELIALARRPVDEGALVRAAMRNERGAADVARGLLDLVRAGLVRSDGGRGGSTHLGVAHAALGEAALAHLGPEVTRSHHAAWAEALERSAPDAEAETIARHWVAAGDGPRAVRFLRRAAESARHAYAFDRARELYQLCLELMPRGSNDATEVLIALGDVVAADGHGAEAARIYTQAAARRTGAPALDLERRAAEQLLKSGRIREGTAALDRVIGHVGLRRARSRVGALVDLGVARLRAGRIVWPIAEGARPVDSAAARRADATWSIATGLGFVDPIVAADFSSRHFVEAAHSHDPLRRLRALTSHAVASAGVGEAARGRVEALLVDAGSIAGRLGTPRAHAYVVGARAAAAALLGDFRASFEAACEADRLFTTEVRDAPWEQVTGLHMMMWSALHVGRLDAILARAPDLFAERSARGDRYGATGLGGHYANLAWLVRSPREARKVLDTCASFWEGEAFNLLSYDIQLGRFHVALAEGDAEEALRIADAAVEALDRAMFMHVGAMRLDASWMRARAAIAALAGARGTRRAALRLRLKRDLAAVERSPIAGAPAIAALARACAAAAIGDHDRAAKGLGLVGARLERAGLDLLAALARRSAALYGGVASPMEHGRLLSTLLVPALPA